MIDLRGKTVVVTGAGAGIGQGIAAKAASRGANVAVDVREDAANETAANIIATGGSARAYRGDVSDLDALTTLVVRI